MKEQHCAFVGLFSKAIHRTHKQCHFFMLRHFFSPFRGTHKFLFVPEMRLITSKNKQTSPANVASPAPQYFSFKFFILGRFAVWLWKFHGIREIFWKEGTSSKTETVNGPETANLVVVFSPVFDNFSPSMFMKFSNPELREKNFNRIERGREKFHPKGAKKDSTTWKKIYIHCDVNTLWGEMRNPFRFST